MTERLTLPLTIYRSLLDHALREAPWECCGLLGGLGGEVRSYHPLTNRALTPRTRYFASPEDLLPAMRTMREAGETLLAIYHSHPEGVPFPSETDRELAFYPQTVYLIVGPLHSDPGLLSSSPPEIRGFLLGRPDIKEVEIQLEGRHEDRRQILVDLLPEFGSAHHSESDLSREEAAAASNEAPPIPSAPERPLEAVLPQAVPVEDRPEELSGESPSEAQDGPVAGDGPLVERVEESSLVAQEVVEPSDDLTEEAIEESSPVVSEEAVAIADLPEAVIDNAPPEVLPEAVPVEDRPEELSDEPPPEAQDGPVAGDGPLVERVEESSLVAQEMVEPSDDLTEEAMEESSPVVSEEAVAVADLPEAAIDNAPPEVLPEAVPVEDRPEELSDEPPPEAQDEPVLGDGPLVERVEESSLVAEEVVEPSDDLTEEAIEESSRVVSEEAVAVADLPEEAIDNAPPEVLPEAVPVEDRPEELSDEPPPEAQDEPVAGDGPLVERFEESSLVAQEMVEPSDDPTEESPQVVPEEPVPVEDLTMEAVDNPPREGFVEIRPSEDPVVKPSDQAPPEQVVEEIASVVEPVVAAPGRSEEEGAGRLTAEPESLAAEPAAEIRTDGWASRLTRKIRSVIVRVARWAFSGRDRQ